MYGLTDEELAYLSITGQLKEYVELMEKLEKECYDNY